MPLVFRLTVVWLILLAGQNFAQDRNAFPFVDLGRAQNIIETLKKENETLKADSERLQQQVEGLKAQIQASQKGTDDLSPLLDEVRARSHELATIAEGIVDTGMKAKAVAAAKKSDDLAKRLAQRLGAVGLQARDWDSRSKR